MAQHLSGTTDPVPTETAMQEYTAEVGDRLGFLSEIFASFYEDEEIISSNKGTETKNSG
jgi:hypothetical protein